MSFEKSLREALAWLDGQEEQGILYSAKLRLGQSQRAEARQQIGAALEEIAALRSVFELQKETQTPESLISAEMTVAWANLWDSRARKLGRYGKVAEGLSSGLDPHVTRLAEIANHLAVIFSDQGAHGKLDHDEN